MIFNVTVWSVGLLSHFGLHYSYQNVTSPSLYVNISDGVLHTCVYPGDSSFKKGSPTYPRAEIRYTPDLPDGTYNLSVSVKNISVPDGFDYSVFQFHSSNPQLMIRWRQGSYQVVAFKLKPKIQKVDHLPKWCVISCGKNGYVDCEGVKAYGRMRCRNKLYFKLGVYSQQMQPWSKSCVDYGPLSLVQI